MTSTFADFGEEWVQKLIIDSGKTLTIGLYADEEGPTPPDTTDNPSDSSDIGDITTEPSGDAYSAQTDDTSDFTASLDDSDDVTIEGSELTFDVSDSSEEVNAYYVTVSYTSDVVGDDGSDTEHLVGTAYLDQSYDLSQFDSSVDFDPAKLTLD